MTTTIQDLFPDATPEQQALEKARLEEYADHLLEIADYILKEDVPALQYANCEDRRILEVQKCVSPGAQLGPLRPSSMHVNILPGLLAPKPRPRARHACSDIFL